MEDYLPQKTTQRAVDFMWHRYLLELEKHKTAHKIHKACVGATLKRFARSIHYRVFVKQTELIA